MKVMLSSSEYWHCITLYAVTDDGILFAYSRIPKQVVVASRSSVGRGLDEQT